MIVVNINITDQINCTNLGYQSMAGLTAIWLSLLNKVP